VPSNLYINTTADPGEAFCISELTPHRIETPDLVLTDKPRFNLYLVDGVGDFDDISGAGGYSVEMLIGLLGQQAVAAQTAWSTITNGWAGELDLNTVELLDLFGSEETVEAFAQITITDGSARPRTYAQQRVRLINKVLPAGPGSPTPVDSYLTDTETLNEFVQNRSAITGLTGGGALNLDGIPTLSVSAGWLVAFVISGTLSFYQLVNGTDAESVPSVIRPDDYQIGVNEKIWRQRFPTGGNVPKRQAGNPNALGLIGDFDWQEYLDTDTGEKFNWNAPTNEWL